MNLFYKFIFIIVVFFSSLSLGLLSQDLDVNQTINYINKKFKEFPYYSSPYTFNTTIYLTSSGELKIEMLQTAKYFDGSPLFVQKITNKIAINKIDIKESFESYHYDDPVDRLMIYPISSGFIYEEISDENGVVESKKTIPYSNGPFKGRNRILIYLGDAGNKGSIRNAFKHLCTLVISDPVEYGLNEETDPFVKSNTNVKPDLISSSSSNSIKLIKTESGLIEVPIVLNDVLRINFIFDSGASEVSISPDVALTLFRTGTISESDWLEDQTYQFADGSIAKSKRFLLKKIVIGNQTLKNIEASISSSIDAPMLIGQNVMNKLGSITIDYENGLLIIKSK